MKHLGFGAFFFLPSNGAAFWEPFFSSWPLASPFSDTLLDIPKLSDLEKGWKAPIKEDHSSANGRCPQQSRIDGHDSQSP